MFKHFPFPVWSPWSAADISLISTSCGTEENEISRPQIAPGVSSYFTSSVQLMVLSDEPSSAYNNVCPKDCRKTHMPDVPNMQILSWSFRDEAWWSLLSVAWILHLFLPSWMLSWFISILFTGLPYLFNRLFTCRFLCFG